MSFRENLQYLRGSRNMTQEQLAMLLGVSRQAISKWESEKAYPEMDKLLMMCDLFGCTLDDLVMGDVRHPSSPAMQAAAASGTATADDMADFGGLPAAASISPEASRTQGRPQDVVGYDEHMRRFAWQIATGVALIIVGLGVGLLFDGNDFPLFLSLIIGVVAGLSFLIPGGLAHGEFVRRHPYIEDFYQAEDRMKGVHELAIGIVAGIALILAGLSALIYSDEVLAAKGGWSAGMMLLFVAAGVFCLVLFGMRYGRFNIAEYNHEAEQERDAQSQEYQRDRYGKTNEAVCGIIMMLATIIGLSMLFIGKSQLFWLAWPIGGILCSIVSLIMKILRAWHDDDHEH